jgi:hypothetical protein
VAHRPGDDVEDPRRRDRACGQVKGKALHGVVVDDTVRGPLKPAGTVGVVLEHPVEGHVEKPVHRRRHGEIGIDGELDTVVDHDHEHASYASQWRCRLSHRQPSLVAPGAQDISPSPLGAELLRSTDPSAAAQPRGSRQSTM